jgi:hypothetical protein
LSLKGWLVIEKPGETTRQIGETVHVEIVTVYNYPQHPSPTMTGQLEVIELEPFRGEIGLYHAPNVSNLRHYFNVSTANRWVPKGAHLTEKRPVVVLEL